MKTAQTTFADSLLTFRKASKNKINKGFVIEERNAKLPFAVLFRKGKKVNYKFNLSLFLLTVGLWSLVWVYLCYVSVGEKRILIALDEDCNTFQDKFYN